MKYNKCLDKDDFKKYMKWHIREEGMTINDHMMALFMMQHFDNCAHCKEIETELINLLKSARSEDLFWQNFNEYWKKKEETGAQEIKLCNVALRKREIKNKIKEFPEWLREKLSDNIDELFSIGFFKKEAVVGAVRGENTSDNVDANNITISFKKTNKGYTVMIGIYQDIKGKLYLEDDKGNIYKSNKSEEGYMEFHNVPTENFTIKYMV